MKGDEGIRERDRRSKFDWGTLYACMEISQ
jgi:hypothetical protein